MKNFISVLTTLLVSSAGAAAFAQSTAPITVTGWGMHYGGNVIYRFQVRNSSAAPVTRLLIGHYFGVNDGRAELSVWPQTAGSRSLQIPANVANRPNGWGVKILDADEQSNFSLEWIEAAYRRKLRPLAPPITEGMTATSGNNGIPPGATWDNFSISLPEEDAGYVTGHATIYYGEEYVNVPIQKGDATPPDLMLSVQRTNQNEGHGHWAIFDVRASTKDNYDPAPTLDFSPVTANQPLGAGDVSIDGRQGNWKVKLRNAPGRIYRLQFTSADASGNKATKVFEYAVR